LCCWPKTTNPDLFALSEYLNLSGAEVLVARTGPETLRLTLASQPDLLLLDVHLPQLDGSEVVRQLRAQKRDAACCYRVDSQP
jgi:DNA-binding response OmpR family regulator